MCYSRRLFVFNQEIFRDMLEKKIIDTKQLVLVYYDYAATDGAGNTEQVKIIKRRLTSK